MFVCFSRFVMQLTGVDHGMGVLTPRKYVGGVRVYFDPLLKCRILSFKTVVG